MENLSPAAITAIATIIGAIISGLVSLIISGWQHNTTIALIEHRLKELEDKVDKHNKLQDRMVAVETKLEVMGK